MRVQHPGDLAHRRAHAGDVRGRRERADPEASAVLGLAKQPFEVRKVNAAIRCEVHLDDGCKPLPPGDFVGVVFVGPDEHDRLAQLLVAAECLVLLRAQELTQLFPDRLTGRRRQEHAEDLLQLVDGTGRTGAAGDDAALGARVHRALDRILSLVQQPAHAAAREVVLGVRVRVDPLQRLQVALDEHQAAARGRVVAVDHQPTTERRVERRVDADDLAAEVLEAPIVHDRDCREIGARHLFLWEGTFSFSHGFPPNFQRLMYVRQRRRKGECPLPTSSAYSSGGGSGEQSGGQSR